MTTKEGENQSFEYTEEAMTQNVSVPSDLNVFHVSPFNTEDEVLVDKNSYLTQITVPIF